jgi:hypothetical protein
MYSAKTKKMIFFPFSFFFCAAAIKIQASLYIYRQKQNKIKNLGVYADFDQESIKTTLTYD